MKKLIYLDTQKFEALKNDFSYWSSALRSVKESYEALEIGKISSDIWEKIKRNEGYDFIRSKYIQDLNNQLDSANIKNQALRSTALSGAEQPLVNLMESIENLNKVTVGRYNPMGHPTLDITMISFIDNEFCISNEDAEVFLDTYCRTYVSTEKQEDLFADLTVLTSMLNRIGSKYGDLIFHEKETSRTPQQAFERLLQVNPGTWDYSINQAGLKATMKG